MVCNVKYLHVFHISCAALRVCKKYNTNRHLYIIRVNGDLQVSVVGTTDDIDVVCFKASNQECLKVHRVATDETFVEETTSLNQSY